MAYQPAPRIRPIAPSPSLVTSARPLPVDRWEGGISWSPNVQRSHVWPWCPGINPDRKELPVDRVKAFADSFVIYTPAICDLPLGGEDLDEQVRELTEVHTAAGLARALWTGEGLGVYDAAKPTVTLRRAAQMVSGTYDLDDAVAVLLGSYETCTGGNGGATIHVPATLIEGALGGSNNGSRVCWPEGLIYRAALGAVVSPGPGYPIGSSADGPFGFGPKTSTDPAAETYAGNSVDEAWVYISGPVEYAVGDIVTRPENPTDRVMNRQNTYEVWGERTAIVRVDPTCVFAVLVNNPAPIEEAS